MLRQYLRASNVCAAVAAVLTVSGCSPKTLGVKVDPATAAREEQVQRDMRVERQYAQQMRALNVAYPMLKGAASLCGEDVRHSVGMIPATMYDFRDEDVAAAQRYGIRAEPTVIGVIVNGPAARAGITRGDVLRSINGEAVPSGKKATAKTIEALAKATSSNPRLILGIERNGTPQQIAIDSELTCSYPVVVSQEDTINAFADGKAIYVTTGMMRFVESDQELAAVIGHELAHNAMGHIKAKTTNFALGSIFDVLAAAYGVNTQGAFGNAAGQAFSQQFESEADYVGIYAMALGGMETHGVANLWRRMGAETGSIKAGYGATHPGTTERYVALEATSAEVNDKIVNNQPLMPNMKKQEP
jgi:membrane-associated protease RseP (regulator of RpoE activity)